MERRERGLPAGAFRALAALWSTVVWPTVVWPVAVQPFLARLSMARPAAIRPAAARPSATWIAALRPSVACPPVIGLAAARLVARSFAARSFAALSFAAVSFAVCWLAVSPAAAQPAGGAVDVEVQVGFSDTFRLGHWTPVTVTVSNRGSDVAGYLEVTTTEGNEFRGDLFSTVHRRRIELPLDARKRLRFTVRTASFTRPITARVITDGGTEVGRQAVDLRHRYTTGRLLAVLGRDLDLDYLNEGSSEGVRVVYPHPGTLPDRWYGYDGIDALILHGVSLEHLEPRQFAALGSWIEQGGTLAVVGSPQFSLLRTPRMASLLPARPVGMTRVEDAAAVGRALGAALHATRPFGINRVERTGGVVLARAGDLPLVLAGTRGRGRVVYLTFDIARYPFAGWRGRRATWERALALGAVEPTALAAGDEPHGEVVRAAISGHASHFPGHAVVIVFLVVYLGALIAGYRACADRTGPRRVLGPVMLLVPVVFVGLGYLLFGPHLFPTGPTAVVVSVIEPLPGAKRASVTLDVGLYSSRDERLIIGYEGVDAALRPGRRPNREVEPARWVFHEDGPRAMEVEDTRGYVLHLLQGRAVVPYRHRAEAARMSRGLRIRIHPDSAAIDDAWVVFRGQAYALGPIAPGEDFERLVDVDVPGSAVDGSAWSAIIERTRTYAPGMTGAVRKVLEREFGALADDVGLGPGEALLIALSPSPVHFTGSGEGWSRREVAVLLSRIKVTGREG